MVGSSIAAVVALRQRRLVEAFRKAGATRPGDAKTLGEVGVEKNHQVDRLVKMAVLRDIGDEHYYLDEPTWGALGGIRRRVAVALVVILIALAVGLLWSPARPVDVPTIP